MSEHDLRHRIDLSVSRALVDDEYARLLLTDPAIVVEARGLTAHQRVSLLSIHASDLRDFTRQVWRLFWLSEVSSQSAPLPCEDSMPLAVR